MERVLANWPFSIWALFNKSASRRRKGMDQKHPKIYQRGLWMLLTPYFSKYLHDWINWNGVGERLPQKIFTSLTAKGGGSKYGGKYILLIWIYCRAGFQNILVSSYLWCLFIALKASNFKSFFCNYTCVWHGSLFVHYICTSKKYPETNGASIDYVGKNLPIFDPPPSSVGKFTT